MRVEVRLYAGLAERLGRREVVLDASPDGLTVGEAKAELARRFPEAGSLAHVRGVLGTRYVADDARIASGDVLHLLPPVSGGSGRDADGDAALERGVFELSSAPLDPADAWRRVGHPSCGAVVVFSGHTRATNRELRVLRLDYEAFEAMAGPEMGRIFAEASARFGPPAACAGEDPAARRLRMLAVHRTGVVEVGEPSVLVAVASPHRAPAFDACRFLIDTLKERLPVWKKESYEGGSHWIGDRS